MSYRSLFLLVPLAGAPLQAQDTPPAAPASVTTLITLDDLFSDLTTVDTAISPSGQYLAAIVRRDGKDILVIADLKTNKRTVIERVGFGDAGKTLVLSLRAVFWKSDERLLYRVAVRPADERIGSLSMNNISKLGDRLFAVNRDGTKRIALLADNRNAALEGAFDMGSIASFLPHDPSHVLMVLDGFNGRSLFKVDLGTGLGEQIEKPGENVVGWWLNTQGNPVVRVTMRNGTVHLYRKNEDKWKLFQTLRMREMRERPDYESVGPSDQEGKFYVLARPPGHDRIGLYLYDLEKEDFGEPVVENPRFDLYSAAVSRDGTRILHHCYVENVRICEFADPKLNAHMKAIRKFFEESANVYIYESSEDGNTIVLYVEGPRDPPAYYYYMLDKRTIETIGAVHRSQAGKMTPLARVIRYNTRDGKELTGYFTAPPAAAAGVKLPLVLYPHGGPELRDNLTFDPWVQYFAARGYAVFQPNFRGSDGYGKAFAESGYGEWGRKMQDDLGDGVKALVDQGLVDASRICIVGASYGGYAALAGATLTPDAYKCAVSVAGISDLDDFIGWRKRNWGRDSAGYTYWLKAIGDPDKDEQRLREVSPLQQVAHVRIPILLIHGTADEIVPFAQSRAMKKALDKSGRKTELIELKDEGHSYWSDENEKLALTKIDAFLQQHLGPGAAVAAPAPK